MNYKCRLVLWTKIYKFTSSFLCTTSPLIKDPQNLKGVCHHRIIENNYKTSYLPFEETIDFKRLKDPNFMIFFDKLCTPSLEISRFNQDKETYELNQEHWDEQGGHRKVSDLKVQFKTKSSINLLPWSPSKVAFLQKTWIGYIMRENLEKQN